MGKQIRCKNVKDFKKYVFEKIFPLFEKVDKKKLDKALASRDYIAVRNLLGISEEELSNILSKGQKLAFRVFLDFLRQEKLFDKLQEFIKKHNR